MHPEARDFVQRTLANLPPRSAVLEIGGRDVNGNLRDLFRCNPVYLSIDVRDGPMVDVVADGATYRPAFTPDTVLCTEVLEHTSQAAAICRNAYEVLGPGGIFIVTTAWEGRLPHSAVDGGAIRSDEYYANVLLSDLAAWLAPFRVVSIETDRDACDIRAWAVKRA